MAAALFSLPFFWPPSDRLHVPKCLWDLLAREVKGASKFVRRTRSTDTDFLTNARDTDSLTNALASSFDLLTNSLRSPWQAKGDGQNNQPQHSWIEAEKSRRGRESCHQLPLMLYPESCNPCCLAEHLPEEVQILRACPQASIVVKGAGELNLPQHSWMRAVSG